VLEIVASSRVVVSRARKRGSIPEMRLAA